MAKVKYTIETLRKSILVVDQQEFADLIGVSRGTVSSWENGKTSPSISNKKKILEISGLKAKDFVDGFFMP